MKKNFKLYIVCWVILLAVFNVICFVVPNEITGMIKLDATFWAAYAFITAAFVGQIICANIAFKAGNSQKLFYNLPIVTVSYTGLILTVVLGGVCMVIPNLPSWIGIIVCLAVLAFTAVAVVKAKAVSDMAESIDEKVKVKTQFIKKLTAETEGILNGAKDDEIKNICKKVYEAVRYSDPMSSEELSVIEAKITVKTEELKTAVHENNKEKATETADEIIALVKERNSLCKGLK